MFFIKWLKIHKQTYVLKYLSETNMDAKVRRLFR